MLVDVDILTNHIVDHALHLTNLLIGNFLEVREVETQGVRANERTLLLYMVAQYLLQSIVEQVSCSMVGCTGIALVCINTGHELGSSILWQLLHDMYALAILTFCVNDLDGLVL